MSIMKSLVICVCLAFLLMLQFSAHAWKKPRKISEGDGINFPRRPVSKAADGQFVILSSFI